MRGINIFLMNVLFTRGIQGLAAALAQILIDAGAALNGVKKTFATARRWHYASVKGQTEITLFGGTHVATQTNLPSTWQPAQNEHLVITGIQLMDADNTTAAAGSVPFTAGIDNAQILNGKLSIINNGVKEIDEIPISEFVAVVEDSQSGLLNLDVPIVWKGQTSLEVRITVPTAVAAINNVYLMGILKGYGTVA